MFELMGGAMDILREASQVIVQPPGDLVYFLVTLFALQQALVAALGYAGGRSGSALARRWVWVTGGLLLGRVVMIAIGLLSVGGFVEPRVALPPLERWLILTSGLGIAWAGLLGNRPKPWHSFALCGALALSLAVFIYDTAMRSSAADLVVVPGGVSVWQQAIVLGVLIAVMCLAMIMRSLEWEWALGVALLWALGTAAELVWPDFTVAVNGWQRLASLAALPLLSVWVHRQLSTSTVGQRQAVALSGALPLVEVVQSISRARDLDSTLIVASSRLADLLGVEMCTLVLADEGSTDAVRVVAIHPPTAVQMDPPRLELSDYAGLGSAFRERSVVIASPQVDDPWLSALYIALGFEKPLPSAIIPLRHQGQMSGVMVLGKPQRGNRWRAEDLEEPMLVAGLVAESISVARSPVARRSEGEAAALGVPLGVQAGAEQQKLVEMLDQAKQQIRSLSARIRTLMQEVKARDEEILALNMAAEPQAPASRETELAVWQNEVRELIEERESLHRKLKELTEDRTVLQTERARLGTQLVAVKEQLAQVEDHRERLEEELADLQSRGAIISTPQRPSEVDLQKGSPPKDFDVDASNPTQATTVVAQARDVDQDRVGLVVVDEDGQITMADALARQMLRLPIGDVVGMPINGAYPDPQWAQTVSDLLTHSRNGGPHRAHLSLSSETGTIEANFAALRGKDGGVDGLAITLRSSESESEQHEAVVSLASELRTPMTAITGYTDLLLGEQAGILTDMQQQFLERVKANVEQLSHLVSDLNQVASPDARSVGLSPKPVSLVQIIEEAIMGLAASFRERRMAVQLDFPEELPLVQADRDSLYQIMLRLISNALACSKEGGQVVVGAREEAFGEVGKHLRISVTDTGGGIAPEDYPRVFRRFYRANQPLVEGLGETGVGMAVAKALVEANGGRIWVESTEGVGSTFSFLLPTGK